MITEARSSVDQSNISEVLDADMSKGMFGGSQAQYFTPHDLALELANKLPTRSPASAIDPQCGEGALLKPLDQWNTRMGCELDNRITYIANTQLITSSCTKVWDIIEDLYPNMRWVCGVANVPFGRKWKINDRMVDSTQATWDFLIKHCLHGYLISNRSTIEKLGLNKSPLVYDYITRKASDYWNNMRADTEIGVVFFQHKNDSTYTPVYGLKDQWAKIKQIVDDEKALRPRYNIFLDHSGILKTYLSIRSTVKLKISWDDVQKLHRINDCHPLALTTEKETRVLMKSLVQCGVYTIEPAAKKAIADALAEVNQLATPLMPVSDFESVAWTDEEDELVCTLSCNENNLHLTAGKSYPLTTQSYKFSETFKRNKVHFSEDTRETFTSEHECVLTGTDTYIAITDDHGLEIHFMDRPRKNWDNEFEEKLLWKFFKKPTVNTVAETFKEAVAQNIAILKALELTAGYKYFPGQMQYLSRMAVKDRALVAADVGTGKSLMAISLIAMKSPHRALIIAPQGAIRSSDSDDEAECSEMDAAQWQKELLRFSPYLSVYEIFSYDDYKRICSMNGGELPGGAVYISYFEALFLNGAREKIPDNWDDNKLNKWAKSAGLAELPVVKNEQGQLLNKRFNCDSIGREQDGIRCIIEPCLSTLISDKFDMVLVDEAHRCFPYNEKVLTERGEMSIGEIVEKGIDLKVLSCNPNSSVTQWKNVTGHFKFRNDKQLVRIHHEHGCFTCTSDHDIYTEEGKKVAASLRPREVLRILPEPIRDPEARKTYSNLLLTPLCCDGKQSETAKKEDWSAGRDNNLPSMQKSVHGSFQNEEANILQFEMRCYPQNDGPSAQGTDKDTRKNTRQKQHQICHASPARPNEHQQSNEKSCVAREDEAITIGKDVSFARRQWEVDSPTENIKGGFGCGLENGMHDYNSHSPQPIQIPTKPLQRGYWESKAQVGHRSGRENALPEKVEVLRQKENKSLGSSRVVRVEILEQGDYTGLCASGGQNKFVYCLEVEGNHNFFVGGVLVSNCKNQFASVSQMLIRMQPKYRYALTATPIPNTVTDIFSLMGWIAVPEWFRGKRLNAAFPYARDDVGRFTATFLSQERDLTQEDWNRRKDPKWRGTCIKDSPIISSPARLLKILKPTMGYIGKPECSDKYVPPKVLDVRVPLGKEQAVLYGHFLDRANIQASNPLVRARKQVAYLRNICADPAGFTHGGPKVNSNSNPKSLAILELTRDILANGEQVVIVNSRIGLTSTLHTKLCEAGVSIARIDSTLPADQHSHQSNLFKDKKVQVLLLGIKCAAAFSYDECDNLIIGSLEYSYGNYAQAIGRIDRLTSTHAKNIYCILHKNSLEELMWEVVSLKGDSATICLRGRRVPREFKPVDPAEVLAKAIERFSLDGSIPESDCELKWPLLRDRIKNALTPQSR